MWQKSRIFSKKKSSQIVAGTGAKTHRNFQWLAWQPGGINEVAINGVDVLTGPMSGCWLTTYRRGGVTYAGHIGTDIASRDKSTAVKAAWNKFANAHADQVIGGFNPTGGIAIPRQKTGDSKAMIFGLITAAGTYYTLFTYAQSSDLNKLRIASLTRVNSAGINALQNM